LHVVPTSDLSKRYAKSEGVDLAGGRIAYGMAALVMNEPEWAKFLGGARRRVEWGVTAFSVADIPDPVERYSSVRFDVICVDAGYHLVDNDTGALRFIGIVGLGKAFVSQTWKQSHVSGGQVYEDDDDGETYYLGGRMVLSEFFGARVGGVLDYRYRFLGMTTSFNREVALGETKDRLELGGHFFTAGITINLH
jgi:hypothetical protein